jgi:hypothetical protein
MGSRALKGAGLAQNLPFVMGDLVATDDQRGPRPGPGIGHPLGLF